MKKTAIIAACMAFLTACTAGAQDIGGTAPAVTQTSETQGTAQGTAETKKPADTEKSAEDASEEDHISSVMEYDFHLPGEYKNAHEGYRRIYKTDTASGSRVWYSLINVPDYALNHPDAAYTVDDAPEILWEYILEDLRAVDYPAGAQKSECVVDTDEKKEMLGNEVIRRTGTFKLTRYGESADLSYAAYYMVSDMQNGDYKKVPVVWFAFSEDSSDEAKAFLEDSVDFTFEKTEKKS